ncbi:MAG: SH3 domain-containing protein [Amaricoccus sp.]|uniref:COG3650 family protein n=1 Tax=Amaricoccus sp. TaxID=1872485 RepID=UPI0039E3C907
MKGGLALGLLLLALPGAGPLPSRFDVVGVAGDSALNVRAEPNASAPVVATLAPDARGVEVVALDASGRWGRVNAGEGSGWSAIRYLQEQPGVWPAGALPAGMRCFGTEPFWSLVPEGTTARLETPDGSESFALTTLDRGHPADLNRALLLKGNGGESTVTITPQACSDGMSDRLFGLEALMVRNGPNGSQLLSGCCSVAAQR